MAHTNCNTVFFEENVMTLGNVSGSISIERGFGRCLTVQKNQLLDFMKRDITWLLRRGSVADVDEALGIHRSTCVLVLLQDGTPESPASKYRIERVYLSLKNGVSNISQLFFNSTDIDKKTYDEFLENILLLEGFNNIYALPLEVHYATFMRMFGWEMSGTPFPGKFPMAMPYA